MSDVANPINSANETVRLREGLLQACDQVGLDPTSARLIHHYANAVYLLPQEAIIARVMYGPQSAHRASLSVRVTRWLTTEHQFPATAPISGLGPVEVGSNITITFWTYYPQPSELATPTSAHLGRLIRRLHELPEPSETLPDWVPLNSLEQTLRSPAELPVVSHDDRVWLLKRIELVRGKLEKLNWPLGRGLIHGDAWAGNLLRDTNAGSEAIVLGDWDSVSRGPREIDLIPSYHAARRYGRGPEWAQAFAKSYGYDLSGWPGFDTLFAMRDLVQLSGPLRRAHEEPALARALRERLEGIKGKGPPVWTEFNRGA